MNTNQLSMAELRQMSQQGLIAETEVEQERLDRNHEQDDIRFNESKFGEHRNRHLMPRPYSHW